MKPEEKYFWNRVKNEVGLYRKLSSGKEGKSPRDIINEPNFSIPHKRAWYFLEKWTDKGWYEYGVTLDLGWVTEKGMETNTPSSTPLRH